MTHSFAKQLRKHRTKANLSKSELARKTGISRHSIIKYESGVNEPEIGNFVLLADALDVSADVLLGRKAKKDKR